MRAFPPHLDEFTSLSQGAADLFQSEKLEDAAEFGRIGRYYAIEDMLTTDPADKYGRTTLRDHYARIAEEGQEYDPYTTLVRGPYAALMHDPAVRPAFRSQLTTPTQ